MTIVLDVPTDLEQDLTAEATRLGLSLPDYVMRLLWERHNVTLSPKTGADVMQYWRDIGVVGSRPDIADSQQHARQIREEAEHRYRDKGD
ncbi:MAG: hypothetical protein Kow0031_40710 [Anaerolineae bacterium]